MKNLVRSFMPASPLFGEISAPGDKSISHRALIFGALAIGETKITGLLEGDDILRTAGAMRGFGAQITRSVPGTYNVIGCGEAGWQSPSAAIDFGNAGTGARLIMGAAAGFDIRADFVGDASLSARPMGRVLAPLAQMGAMFDAPDERLPLSLVKGGNLKAVQYTPPHASAQVKSALLLAGLNAHGVTEITETRPTRDHSENMLAAFGVPVTKRRSGGGDTISITGPARLRGCAVNVPGDPSSAAFLIAAALIVPGSDIQIKNVMMNPGRTGFFEVIAEMGGFLRADNFRRSGGETIADIHVKQSKLIGVNVPESRVPSMIDEYPILAVCAAFAKGETTMRGLAELRVKESDRLTGTNALLKVGGAKSAIKDDTLIVTGTDGGTLPGGGSVKTHHDHRLAMSALILGLRCENGLSIDDASMIATSFPTFFDLMSSIGAKMDAGQ